ncbi:MAG TPA: KamA family radical SAM protein [Myxococcota bacterium]|nr:KamA family radical SAM protein [Myxococcota bacterium]
MAARPPYFRDVSDAQWNDWKWQQAHRIRSLEVLEQVLVLSDDERQAVVQAGAKFAMAITPYYASIMDREDPKCPVRRQAVPVMAELEVAASELEDPLAEDSHMPVPNLTHRYPDRALLYATHNCPVYCRHCNRKRKVGDPTSAPKRDELVEAIDYVRKTPAIRDVLVSGGDPLTMADQRLVAVLADLRSIPHLEIIRIATRNPVTLPMRITPELVSQLRAFHPLFVNTHFNHEKECTEEAGRALTTLADAGCVVGNQMVLLKGINDDPSMVRRMNQWLLKHRCRPYYIFQCDSVEGASHFRTPVESGVNIIRALRGWTSGLAVPHYVVDLPNGGGKVPVQPVYLTSHDGTQMKFVNYAGEAYTYEEGA